MRSDLCDEGRQSTVYWKASSILAAWRFVCVQPREHWSHSAQRDRNKPMTTKIIPPAFIVQAEEQLDKGYDPKVARGLLRFVKPYAARMFFALILMIIVTASAVSWPYFVKLAID